MNSSSFNAVVKKVDNAVNSAKKAAPKKAKAKRKPRALLNFKNMGVFDKKFKNDIESCTCLVSKMLFAKKINVDGSIDVDNMNTLRKHELWSYIYYLYYFNNTSIDEFASMKGNRGVASAENFYKTVKAYVDNKYVFNKSPQEKSVTSFDVQTLAYFINSIVHQYGNDLANPIINYVKDLLKTRSPIFNSFAVKTNSNSKIEILQGNAAKNANVKIKF